MYYRIVKCHVGVYFDDLMVYNNKAAATKAFLGLIGGSVYGNNEISGIFINGDSVEISINAMYFIYGNIFGIINDSGEISYSFVKLNRFYITDASSNSISGFIGNEVSSLYLSHCFVLLNSITVKKSMRYGNFISYSSGNSKISDCWVKVNVLTIQHEKTANFGNIIGFSEKNDLIISNSYIRLTFIQSINENITVSMIGEIEEGDIKIINSYFYVELSRDIEINFNIYDVITKNCKFNTRSTYYYSNNAATFVSNANIIQIEENEMLNKDRKSVV